MIEDNFTFYNDPNNPGAFFRLMAWFFSKIRLGGLYRRLWNPINYFTIGGIGAVINYLVLFLFHGFLGWSVWLVNILAIIIAALWNWSQSVGPLGYLWGFRKKTEGWSPRKWFSR